MIDKDFINKLAVEASVSLYDPIDNDNPSYVYEWYPGMHKFLSNYESSSFLIESDQQAISIELSKYMYSRTGQKSSAGAYDQLANLISSRIANYRINNG